MYPTEIVLARWPNAGGVLWCLVAVRFGHVYSLWAAAQEAYPTKWDSPLWALVLVEIVLCVCHLWS